MLSTFHTKIKTEMINIDVAKKVAKNWMYLVRKIQKLKVLMPKKKFQHYIFDSVFDKLTVKNFCWKNKYKNNYLKSNYFTLYYTNTSKNCFITYKL